MPTVKKIRKKKGKRRTGRVRELDDHFTESLSLPDSDNIPTDRLEDSVIMVYGRKAIGKTSLVNNFDGALTFMFERARRNLSIRQVPHYTKSDKKRKSLKWEQFKEYIDLFIKSDEYQMGIIDTLDRCYVECFQYVCHNAGVNHPDQSSRPFEIWDVINQEFEDTLSKLQESGKGLIFLSHEKAKPLVVRSKPLRRDDDDDEEKKIARMEPSCKPAGVRAVEEICDYVIYYCFVGNRRVLCVRSPNEYAWTACGFDDHFLDPDGTPIERFEAGDSPQKAYQSLIDAYNNKLRDIDYIPVRRTKKKRRKT